MIVCPCVKNKCLLFPICKTKVGIKCPDLTSYHQQLFEEAHKEEVHSKHWDVWYFLHKDLPSLKVIE